MSLTTLLFLFCFFFPYVSGVISGETMTLFEIVNLVRLSMQVFAHLGIHVSARALPSFINFGLVCIPRTIVCDPYSEIWVRIHYWKFLNPLLPPNLYRVLTTIVSYIYGTRLDLGGQSPPISNILCGVNPHINTLKSNRYSNNIVRKHYFGTKRLFYRCCFSNCLTTLNFALMNT